MQINKQCPYCGDNSYYITPSKINPEETIYVTIKELHKKDCKGLAIRYVDLFPQTNN